jgi:hypothetical protein
VTEPPGGAQSGLVVGVELVEELESDEELAGEELLEEELLEPSPPLLLESEPALLLAPPDDA